MNTPITAAHQALLDFAMDAWGIAPDFPFEDDPEVYILRHPRNRKWFGAIMPVKRVKLGLPGEGYVTVVNVKCSAETIATLLGSEGFHPAYHMNKSHWMTVLLDGTVPDEMASELLMESYSLVE